MTSNFTRQCIKGRKCLSLKDWATSMVITCSEQRKEEKDNLQLAFVFGVIWFILIKSFRKDHRAHEYNCTLSVIIGPQNYSLHLPKKKTIEEKWRELRDDYMLLRCVPFFSLLEFLLHSLASFWFNLTSFVLCYLNFCA